MIAEIFTGENDWADVAFAVAVVLAVVAAVLARGTVVKASSYAIPLGFLAVAFIAFGLCLL